MVCPCCFIAEKGECGARQSNRFDTLNKGILADTHPRIDLGNISEEMEDRYG